MRRRIYFLFADAAQTKSAVNQLLVKRVDIKHMHVVANDKQDLSGLPEASMLQKNDIRHSLILGGLIGAFLGIGAAIAFHHALYMPYGPLALLITLVGIIFGAWASSMIGMTTPNTELKSYQQDIDNGKFLLIADVEKERVEEIESLIRKLHPGSVRLSEEPIKPSFP